ncbi:MAG: peptide ABC transporter permease [Bacillota bacterium]|nr:MAG: peptide ABC transporter permease [Bacillota bacterium]
MWRYIVKRILWLVIILLCVAIVIFGILWVVPGNPAQIVLGAGATQADIDRQMAIMGLDRPFLVQLTEYLSDVFLHFDFGESYIYGTPVIEEFAARLPRTLGLGLISMLLNVVIGIPLGINAAIHRNSFQDQGLLIAAMIFISVPQFFLALLMVSLFSVKLGWLPPYGIGGWQYWILPVLANSLSGIAMNARQTRSAVLETIRSDFVTTARAKGLPEWAVIYKHMLPNALIPVVNALGMQLAAVVGGTVVIEQVFSFPGIGEYLLTGMSSRDYPVIRGSVLILAIFSAVITLLVDLFYGYLDPRIKAQYINYAAKKKVKKNES